MLLQCTWLCVLLLTMCHVALYEKRYSSDNWHVKSKVDRPYIVQGRKNVHKGVFTMKRGNQTLSLKVSGTLNNMASGHSVSMNNLIQCRYCQCRSHKVTQCPLLQCTRCLEFGHTTFYCKKTLPEK